MSWDEYAQRYAQVDHQGEDLPPLLDLALDASIGRLLDVGCGEGFLLDRLRRNSPGWHLEGFEISEHRAAIARRRGHLVTSNPRGDLRYPPRSFDVVTSCHVIEHVDDDRTYARELAGLVRPGGYLYIETPLKLRGAWYFRRNAKAGWVLDPTHVREYRSPDEALAPALAAGLRLVEQRAEPLLLALSSAESLARRVLRLPQPPSGPPVGWRARHVSLPRYRVHHALFQVPSNTAADGERPRP